MLSASITHNVCFCVFVFIYHTENSNLQHDASFPTLTLCLLCNIIPHISHLLTLGFLFQKVTSASYLIILERNTPGKSRKRGSALRNIWRRQTTLRRQRKILKKQKALTANRSMIRQNLFTDTDLCGGGSPCFIG